MKRIVVIDDESSVRETLVIILKHHFSEVEIVEASGVVQGYELLQEIDPDIIFIDVEMGDGTGFDLLTRLGRAPCPVIFVTAHENYALKAFKFSATDYILKPVAPADVVAALEKIGEHNSFLQTKYQTLLAQYQLTAPDKLILTDTKDIHLVKITDIIRCQAVSNYTHFYLASGQEVVISKTLKYYEELLLDAGFHRIHQSHLINLNHITRYDKHDGGQVIMSDGSKAPVALRKKEEFIQQLRKLGR